VGFTFKIAQDLLGPSSLVFGFSPLFAVILPALICALAGVWLEAGTDGLPEPTANGPWSSCVTLPDESGAWAGLGLQVSPDAVKQGCRLAPGMQGRITWKWAWPVELTVHLP